MRKALATLPQMPDLLTNAGGELNQGARPFLPPPARMILIYAILGWDHEQNPPAARHTWLPAFIRMICARNRLQQLCNYALAALRHEAAPPELLETVQRAFAAPGFDMMMVDALAEQSIRCR